MKKIILSAIFISSLTIMATAQHVKLNVYGSYIFSDNVNTSYSSTSYANVNIKGGFQWGLGAEFMVQPQTGVELKYTHQGGTADVKYYADGEKSAVADFNTNYLLLDGNYYFHTGNSNVEPYLGGGIGAAFLYATNQTSGATTNHTAFAWDLKGGVNIFFNEKVGVKLQASLNSASKAVNGYYYYGYTTYSYVSMLQFGLGGGLVFKFGGK